MGRRFYILLLARDGDGELRKIRIPMRYFSVLLAGIMLGTLATTGIAGS